MGDCEYKLPGDNINCDFQGNPLPHITQLEIHGDLLQLIHEGLWELGYSFKSENALNIFLLRMGAISIGDTEGLMCVTIGRRFYKRVVVEIGVGVEQTYEGSKLIIKTFLYSNPRQQKG